MKVGGTVSARAIDSRANRRTLSRSSIRRAFATVRPILTHSPGGWTVPPARLQYWKMSFFSWSKMAALPSSFTSAKAAA